MHLQLGIATIKMSSKKLSIQRKEARFILNGYNRNSSVSKLIKKLNLDSIELRRKVKKLKVMHSIASPKVSDQMP